MIVSLIVAVSENGVIGRNNNLIWHLPNDIKFFKNTTIGHHVIMGRKNFESIPHKYRPLPNRKNIIITRNPDYQAEQCIVVNSIENAIKIAKKNKENEVFIIGGGQIYKLALEANLINKIYLTRVKHSFQEGDTFFPKLNSDWKETIIKKNKADKKHAYNYDFITLEKISNFTKN